MTFFIFLIVFGLSVVFPCKGQVENGDRVVLPPEGPARVQWQFDIQDISKVAFRTWHFTSSDGAFDDELLAKITSDDKPVIESKRLAGLKIEKPATLALKNVNQSYNGLYTFTVSAGRDGGKSTVTIIVAEKPKVTVNCLSTNRVVEGDNFMCLCKGEGGNPAPADVTWYDNNGQTIGTGKGEKLLTLNNVTIAKNGSYKCEAKTHEQAKNETSIQLMVKYIRSFTSSPVRPVVGQTVTITCVAYAHSKPTYTIIRHGKIVRTGKPYIISNVGKDDAGTYMCKATNAFGHDSESYTLVVADDESKNETGLGVGAIVGIVIGVLVFLLLVGGILYWFKVKSDQTDGGHKRVGNDSPDRKPRGNTSDQPNEYATLEQPITYAALDKKDLKKGGPEKPTTTHTPTEYADIQVA